MSSAVIFHNTLSVSVHSPKCYYKNQNQTLALTPSLLLPSKSKSIPNTKKHSLPSTIRIKQFKNRNNHALPMIYAAQSNFLRVIQTAWKVGKDGIEAGTNLVPDSVPRPVARISVTVVGGVLALFVLKSFLSTAFFVLGMMGLIYFTFIALNKDEGPKGGGGTPTSTQDSLEEARRIMDKYK